MRPRPPHFQMARRVVLSASQRRFAIAPIPCAFRARGPSPPLTSLLAIARSPLALGALGPRLAARAAASAPHIEYDPSSSRPYATSASALPDGAKSGSVGLAAPIRDCSDPLRVPRAGPLSAAHVATRECSLPLGARRLGAPARRSRRAPDKSPRRADFPRAPRSALRLRALRSRVRNRNRHTFSAARAFCSTSRIETPVARRASMMVKISRTIRGASPSEGSSSISSRGRPINARPIASICRSPPESVPAELVAPLGEPRELPIHVGERLPPAAVAVARAMECPQLTGCRPPSSRRTIRGAPARGIDHATTRCYRLEARFTRPRSMTLAARRQHAHHRGQQRRLARAVGADDGDDGAGRHGAAPTWCTASTLP